MKKIACLLMFLGLFIQPVFCAVKQTINPYKPKDSFWTKHYDVYEVQYTNGGENPVMITNIDFQNALNSLDKDVVEQTFYNESKAVLNCCRNIPVLNWVAIVPLCIKSDKTSIRWENLEKELDDYSIPKQVESAKNEILLPQETKSIKFLVNKKETPKVVGTFQDTITKESILAK